MSQAPEKIHDPETGVYIGLIWERDGRFLAEDRNGDRVPESFSSFDDAFDRLDERWATHPLNAREAA